MQKAINASRPLATLLLQRGIKDFESARLFFNPEVSQLHPPFLMKDMDKAVERISEAIENEENILVYGDYDVDGTTAVSLLYGFLASVYDKVTYYIPDRYGEGYGISFKGIDFAADNEVSLIIALDCGIKAIEQIDYAKEKGIDFIICDHHLPGTDLPKAHAILNPLQKGCEYPYKALSGCGIGFKLLQACLKAWEMDAGIANAYIDLVAISSACDIVPMTGENRVLTHFGLQRIHQEMRPGLKLLFENAGLVIEGRLKRTLNVSDLVFVIGPRINAAGRMDHGSMAVELLTAENEDGANNSSESIIASNTDRREVDVQTLDEALEMIRTNPVLEQAKSTVLYHESWHKGVIGIVASRLQDHYYRPTIMLTRSNDKASGSARSVKGFDVHWAIEQCRDLLDSFGGHKAAAGMTLKLENIEDFKKRFDQVVAEAIEDEMLIPSLEVDVELDFTEINNRFYGQVLRIAPFGPDNMRPVFMTRNCLNAGRSRRVGDGSHLKLHVRQMHDPDHQMAGIAFKLGDCEDLVCSGEPFDIAYSLEINDFNGRQTLEMIVRDIRPSAEAVDS